VSKCVHCAIICNIYIYFILIIQRSISEKQDEFHEFQHIVLSVVQTEVVPEFKTLQGRDALTNSTLNEVLQISIAELCTNLSWLTSLTAKQGFCWGIVATCCAKITLTADSFDWFHDYQFLISQLGHVYKTYCNGEGIRGEDEKLLKDQLPPNITFYDDIRK